MSVIGRSGKNITINEQVLKTGESWVEQMRRRSPTSQWTTIHYWLVLPVVFELSDFGALVDEVSTPLRVDMSRTVRKHDLFDVTEFRGEYPYVSPTRRLRSQESDNQLFELQIINETLEEPLVHFEQLLLTIKGIFHDEM